MFKLLFKKKNIKKIIPLKTIKIEKIKYEISIVIIN